jgi:hypothetical protein
MSNYKVINARIQGFISSDPATKGELGRRFAYCLGLTPGPPGPDGGVDGEGYINGLKIYFQSKLKNKNLEAKEADVLHSCLIRRRADIGVMLAGVGYTSPTRSKPKDGFKNRLLEFPDIERFRIHLLTLRDIFEENQTFKDAVNDLPPLRELNREVWNIMQ